MTHQYIRFVCLLVLSAFAGPAHCDWSGTWSLYADSELGGVQKFGPGPNPTTGTTPSVHSLSVTHSLSGDSGDTYSNGKVNIAGLASINAVGTHFGIFTSADVVDTTPGYGGNNYIESEADLDLADFMTCITDTNHHRIRMTSYWQINGDLTSTIKGQYSQTTPPVTPDYVNASARSELKISGTGVEPGPYGPTQWGDSFHSIDSTVTFNPNNYQNDPPAAIPITLFFVNNVPESYLLHVDAYSIATVDNNDIFNGQGGSALAVLNMGHTFTWGGITSVTDADTGEPITNWTLTSASGTDWATLAPEPSSLVCATVGIALLGLGRARRLATSGGLFELSKNTPDRVGF